MLFLEKIRVGKDYQVIIPEMNNIPKLDNYHDRALLVWSPVKDISEERLDEYIELAKQKYGYNAEQALGMLFWHKHDLQKAVLDLQNFTPFPDEWSKEDRILFEQAYQFHGKCFHRIRQMVSPIAPYIDCILQLMYEYLFLLVTRQEHCKFSKVLLFLEKSSDSIEHRTPREEKT